MLAGSALNFGKLIGLVAVLVGLYLLWKIRIVILLVFSAIAIATVLNRIVRQLTRWRLHRGLAITVTLATILATVAIIVATIVPRFIDQVAQWLDQVPLEAAQVSQWLTMINDRVPIELSEQVQQLETFIRDIPRVVQGIFNNFFLIFRATLTVVLNSLLVLVIIIMLLANPRAYRSFYQAVPPVLSPPHPNDPRYL